MINLQCRLWLDNNEYLDLTALLDTGATKSVISHDMVPKQFKKELTYKLVTRTIEDRLMIITHCIEPIDPIIFNFIISLLLQIIEKLNILLNKSDTPQSSTNTLDNDLDKIISGINKLSLGEEVKINQNTLANELDYQ